MSVIIGPVLVRGGAYAFSIWTPETGLSPGYAYRRIDDAYYARNAAHDGACLATGRGPIVCATLDVFHAEIAVSRTHLDCVLAARRRRRSDAESAHGCAINARLG